MAEGYNQLIVTNPVNVYDGIVIADGPLLYWRFGESAGPNAADSSGNSRTGTYAGSGVTYSVASLVGNELTNTAVTLNGSTGRVSIADASWMDIATAGSWEAWVNTSTLAFQNIASRDDNSAQQAWQLRLTDTGLLSLVLWSAGPTLLAAPSAGLVADGATHHVVATYDGSNVRLYVDSVLMITSPVGAAPIANVTQPIEVGSLNGTLNFFNGTIDEFAHYNRALSTGEVLEHYQAGLATDHTDIFRYVVSEGIDTAIRIAADLGDNAVFNDWEIISGIPYAYYARAYVSTGGYTDSDPTNAVTNTLEGLWITQVTRDSSTSNAALAANLNAMRATKTPKYQSASFVFKGRSKAQTIFGQNTETVVSYDVVIPNAERSKLDTLEALFAADTTLCIRDVKGNRIFGRASGIPFQDQHVGDFFSLEFHDEDFSESA